MKTTLPGILIVFVALAMAMSNGVDLGVFLNPHALVLVIGGCIGIFFLCTPASAVTGLLRLATRSGMLSRSLISESPEINRALLQLSKSRLAPLSDPHPLIQHAQELWEQGIDSELFVQLLEQELEELNQSSAQAVAALRNLAKYPPSLGMTGTVVGLVGLFSSLTPEKRAQLGPNLAVAMTATFYGLVLANMVIMPVADRLQSAQLAAIRLNEHVFQAILLIHQQETQPVIETKIRSYAA